MEGELHFRSKLLGLIPEIQEKTLGGRKVAFASRKLELEGSHECNGVE